MHGRAKHGGNMPVPDYDENWFSGGNQSKNWPRGTIWQVILDNLLDNLKKPFHFHQDSIRKNNGDSGLHREPVLALHDGLSCYVGDDQGQVGEEGRRGLLFTKSDYWQLAHWRRSAPSGGRSTSLTLPSATSSSRCNSPSAIGKKLNLKSYKYSM